jgi:glycosyltransferase involved in cell wall biosynthesis
MVLLTHPFGNANVRALLAALQSNDSLVKFVTTVGWSKQSHPGLPPSIREALRRNYELPPDKIEIHPFRESVRLLASRFRWQPLIEHEVGWASIDRVWQNLDRTTARRLRGGKYSAARCVYAYEDCAEQTFLTAGELGLKRIYDLPIAYWQTAVALLRQEVERYPDWEPTLGATRDSQEKLARKSREVELADLVICPSTFVLESLPREIRQQKRCLVVPFGTPVCDPELAASSRSEAGPLRVLFAGALSQRKGLADVFAAIKRINSQQVELVVMGSLIKPLNWYRQRLPNFVYERPRPHDDVLKLMQSCDIFVLPSIVEGRALVQQEAMACGLPVIVTRNAGADDLIVDGETGFLVPIRAPEAIAETISWFLGNRDRLAGMRIAARNRASQRSWQAYGDGIVKALHQLISQ